MTKAQRAKLIKDSFYKATDSQIEENGEARVFNVPSARVKAYAKARNLSVCFIGDGEYKIY